MANPTISPDLPRRDLPQPPPAESPVLPGSPPTSPNLPRDLPRNLPALLKERGRRGDPKQALGAPTQQTTGDHPRRATFRRHTRETRPLTDPNGVPHG